jgi:prostatic aicd phosphatase
MIWKFSLVALFSAVLIAAQSSSSDANSNVVAVFLLGRHGDRTPKIQGSQQLTTLGKNQVFESATYFRDLYLDSSSPDFIVDVDTDYLYNQIYIAAPYVQTEPSLMFRNQDVLGMTATAFLQGFYPPSESATDQTLTNGTTLTDPLDGYQYVLINGIPANAPDTIWIEGDVDCPTYTTASNAYYQSPEYLTMQQQLQPFYNKFIPLLQGIFPESQIGFQTAYNIYDYFSVGINHNQTIYANLSTEDLQQLRVLADQQTLALVYNVSAPITSIGGQTLSGAVLSQLNQTVSGSQPALKITYFAGSYDIFQAFWGISGLLNVSVDFYGLPDFASTMTWELRRPINSSGNDDLFVRYGFRNGSDPTTDLQYFPLFGQSEIDIPWDQFVEEMNKQSISTYGDWCNACSSTLSFCAAYTSSSSTPASSTSVASGLQMSSQPVSPVGAGFIGAGVTLAVCGAVAGLFALWWSRTGKKNTKQRPPLVREKTTASGSSSFATATV